MSPVIRRPAPVRRWRPAALTALAALIAGAGCGDAGREGAPLYEGDVWGGNLAVADGRVYFTTFGHGAAHDHAVWSVPAGGGEPTLIWHGAPDRLFGYGMAVHDGDVFWSQDDAGAPAVFSAPIGGGARAALGSFTETQAPAANVTVDDDWIFAGSAHQILRIPRRGGPAVIVYTGDVQ